MEHYVLNTMMQVFIYYQGIMSEMCLNKKKQHMLAFKCVSLSLDLYIRMIYHFYTYTQIPIDLRDTQDQL